LQKSERIEKERVGRKRKKGEKEGARGRGKAGEKKRGGDKSEGRGLSPISNSTSSPQHWGIFAAGCTRVYSTSKQQMW